MSWPVCIILCLGIQQTMLNNQMNKQMNDESIVSHEKNCG